MPAPLHIITLVKWVPDSQLERRFTHERRLDRSEGILAELDEHPLEAALQIKESVTDRQVTVSALTIGPAGASAALKKALQIGADEGFHLNDDALVNADTSATSQAAAAAVAHVRSLSGLAEADYLLVAGMASEDGESGAMPLKLAERLGLPAITQTVELGVEDSRLSAVRVSPTETQRLATNLPALVTVTDQANEPRYPNFRAIMRARKKPTTTFTLADAAVDAAAVTPRISVLSAEPRPERTAGEIIADDGEAGIRLVDYLEKERLL